MKRPAFRIALLILPVLGLLGFTVYAAWTAWGFADGVEMGGHASFAIVLAVVFTLGLTGVLVWLLIYSERRGYDQ
ncbi:MAG: hypothetical protein AB7F35_16085 [Acetobacteraceae bacterium]